MQKPDTPAVSRPQSGRSVWVRRSPSASRPQSAAVSVAAASSGAAAVPAGERKLEIAAPGKPMRCVAESVAQSQPRRPPAQPQPQRPATAAPATRRDAAGLLVNRSVLGPSEDYESELRRRAPPATPANEPAPASPADAPADEPAAPVPPMAPAAGGRAAETPSEEEWRRKMESQERALDGHARWQRQHAWVARELAKRMGRNVAAEELMMLNSGQHREQLEMLDLMQMAKPFWERRGSSVQESAER